jgi:phosphoglycolate phosphatase-like HAD superfamily hydrolase
VRLAGEVTAAVIVPQVPGYPPDQVELIAALPLRERLGLRDGDSLEIEIVRIPRLRAVIFDVDGTLVDSIGAYYIAASRASAEHGFSVPADAIRVALNGGTPFWHLVVPEPQRSAELIATLRERTMRHWPAVLAEHVTVFPGIGETIGLLAAAGLKLAIYTGSQGESLPPLAQAGLMHHFDPVLTSAHVGQRKPHPEGLIRCLEALRVSPDEAAYVGDSVQDIQAARAAGMTAIGVLSGTADSALLAAAGPHRVLRDHSALPGALSLASVRRDFLSQ